MGESDPRGIYIQYELIVRSGPEVNIVPYKRQQRIRCIKLTSTFQLECEVVMDFNWIMSPFV